MARPDRATFRLPAWALLLPIMLLFLVTPLATVNPAWAVLFLVPLAALIWVLITRTTATGTRMTTSGLLGVNRMNWTDLDRLEVRDSRWVVAVGNDGRRLRLPMVRAHDLRKLIAISGGALRVGDPPTPDADRQGDPGPESDLSPVPADEPAGDWPNGPPTSQARVAERVQPRP